MTARKSDFDTYIAVDFSANKSPKAGKDSIWWSRASWSNGQLVVAAARNPRTREAALSQIRQELVAGVALGDSVLIGFDFPYGYPAGFAASLGLQGPAWRATWDFLCGQIQDDQDRELNNRFDVAAAINVKLGGVGPFWGCPDACRIPGLTPTKASPPKGLREFRLTETATQGPKPTWQLFYNGSVGSQALLGLPRLASLCADPELASITQVWPFETGPELPSRADARARIVHVEIYPSLVAVHTEPGRVKDALQVEAQVRFLGEQDERGTLRGLFEAPRRLAPADLANVVTEEGWILGVP